MNVTRGFTGRPRVPRPGLPPGQYDAGDDWPVLSAEVTPALTPADWTFRVDGLVEEPGHLLDEGIARVAETLRGEAGRPGEELCTCLVETAPRRADDIAFLLIRLL